MEYGATIHTGDNTPLWQVSNRQGLASLDNNTYLRGAAFYEYDVKDYVIKPGMAVMIYPDGIDWNGNETRIVIGIAANGNDHMAILSNIALKLCEMETVNEIVSDFLDDDNILLIPFINFLSTSAVFSREGIIEIMDKYLYEETIKKINIYVSCTNIYDFKPHYFKLNDYSLKTIKKILLASSAIPAIFPPENIRGKLYIDGGISDNSPIKALKNYKFTDIIIVHLKQNNNSNILKNKLDNDINIYELYPKKNLGSFFEGTLNFSSKFIKKCMQHGYIDALNLLK